MGKPEGIVENYLVNRCKANGFLCYKFVSPGHNGVPDRIVIGNGRVLFIELKAKNGHPSALQIETIRHINDAGGDARLCYSCQAVDAIIDDLAGTHNTE